MINKFLISTVTCLCLGLMQSSYALNTPSNNVVNNVNFCGTNLTQIKIPVIALLGKPGAGKGTQAARLSKKYNLPIIGIGKLLRAESQSSGTLGNVIKLAMKKGELVDDEVVFKLLKNEISHKQYEKGFILDGFPRNVNQAKKLNTLIGSLKSSAHILPLNIDISDKEVINRVLNRRKHCEECKSLYQDSQINKKTAHLCKDCMRKGKIVVRDDDNQKTAELRLKTYYEQIAPVVAFYKKHSMLYTIHGDKQERDAVTTKMISVLGSATKEALCS